ncbi:MAG: hypothetical protein AAGG11_24010 [Pseudomonadota bacterium]
MQRHRRHMVFQEVPRRGHAPMLDEPEWVTAITAFIEGLDGDKCPTS